MPDTPGSRIVGPKARRKRWSVQRSSVYLASRPSRRTLNTGTRHARELFLWRHSFDLHLSGVRVGRIAAASNKCLVYEREPATLLARRQQLSDSFSYVLALLRAPQPRSNARLPYLIRLLASRGPSIPSPHPVTAVFFSGKIALLIPRLPCIGQTLAPLREPRACESMRINE